MIEIPDGIPGRRRKLTDDQARELTLAWLKPATNRTELAAQYELSRIGARTIVQRYLREHGDPRKDGEA